jgi:hypothetical protein
VFPSIPFQKGFAALEESGTEKRLEERNFGAKAAAVLQPQIPKRDISSFFRNRRISGIVVPVSFIGIFVLFILFLDRSKLCMFRGDPR